MSTGRMKGRWRVTGAALVLYGVGVLAPAPALAKHEAHCPPGQTLLDIEHKDCPITPNRPPLTLARACCLHKDGKTKRCDHFPHCPKRSPS